MESLITFLETIRELISYGELNLKSENLQKLYGYYLLNAILQIGNELIGKGIFHHLEELPDFSSLIELENFLNELAERICKKMGEIPKKTGMFGRTNLGLSTAEFPIGTA